jgi:hypothetical protein
VICLTTGAGTSPAVERITATYRCHPNESSFWIS